METFLWIKIVNACFKQLGNFCSLQQCDIILCIMVLNIEHLFRIIMLIWSCGQGDPLDLSLLIKPVISLYVGCFKSNTFKGSFSFFIQVGNSSFRFFITCQSFFKKRMVCLFIKTWFNCFLFFEHFFTVTLKVFRYFFVIVTVFNIQRFFNVFRFY